MYYGGLAGIAVLVPGVLALERSVLTDGVTVGNRVTGAAQ